MHVPSGDGDGDDSAEGNGNGLGDDLRPDRDEPPEPGPSPIRRMTRFEYNNSVFQLFGQNTRPADAFSPDQEAQGFTNQAEALVVSPLLAEQYADAAEKIADAHADKIMAELSGCDAGNEEQCRASVLDWLTSFGARIYRRPLSDEEIDELLELFGAATEMGEGAFDPYVGVSVTLSAMLQSPYFLYRIESGQEDDGDVMRLTPHEMASRLAFLFWNSTPDAILLEKADAGGLSTRAEIRAEAERLVVAPRAREAVKNFHREWLGLRDIEGLAAIGKDLEIYPDYEESILPLLQQEAEEFFDHAIYEEDASLMTLLTAPWTMMNAELAAFYGVEGPTGDEFEKVALDADKYSGFLTQGGLLAVHAKPNRSSPIHRGLFVRERLFCQIPPSPPDNVPEPPEVDTSLTTREQFAMHEAEPVCAGCHQQIDPIGLGFEHFDGLGRYRDKEWGLEIDASGEIIGTSDADGEFDGVTELGQILANSRQVSDCLVTQWFRYAYGRSPVEEDEPTLTFLQDAFEAADYDIKGLLVALTQTDTFLYRKRLPEPSAQEEVSP
ncbi:MAG: DUF1592 domain-containing protein [Myxococcales bacterium]|nr:DUF1592 domain-containing protein [Myxococcales bacterium]